MKYSGRIRQTQNIEYRLSVNDRGQFVLELFSGQCY